MNLLKKIAEVASLGLETLYPALCEVCSEPLTFGEEIMCLKCRASLPETNFHRYDSSPIHIKLMQPGLPINKAASMFYYSRQSPYAALIRSAKYNGRPRIIRCLACEYAEKLKTENFFDGIDMLQPIPMHWLKRFRRGFNQSEEICKGISDISGLPIADNLKARRHSTQTRKQAYDRLVNADGTIYVNDADELEGKHILLVDDVITTGATLITAASTIQKSASTATISVLSLAITV